MLDATLRGGETGAVLVAQSPDELLKIAPVVNPEADVRALRLNAQEGFLLSQIDGMTPAGVLCDLVALDETVLVIALQRLEKRGVIRWAGRHADPERGRRAVEDSAAQRDIAQASATDPALDEECDLSRDERLQILQAERDFPRRTYWEILGLSGDPSPTDIKRAYFVASKSFHPDRFFGRNLGSFTDRLEKIFFLLKQAYDTLTNDGKRRAYRQRHPPPVRPTPEAEARPARTSAAAETPADKEARLEARRRQIIEERKERRRARFAPSTAGKATNRRAGEMYQAGLSQLRAGDVFAAVASFKLAMTYEPEDAQYRSMFEEANAQAMLARAVEIAAQADSAAKAGAVREAARLYARAFEMTPNKSEYAVKAADCFLQVRDLEEASHFAAQAVEAAPRRVSARVVLAAVLEAAGDKRAAVEHLRAAESLDPTDAHVRKNLRRLTN